MTGGQRLHVPGREVLVRVGSGVGGWAVAAPSNAQDRRSSRPVPRLEALFEMTADLQKPIEVGTTPAGERRIFMVTSGTFEGAAMRGTILPGGGDWLLRRPDGVSELDVRVTLRTDDAQLIYMRYRGINDMPPAVADRRRRGESIRPDEYYFRTTAVFETASAKYAWLNRIITVGVGEVGSDKVAYTVYAVR
jgi:hypothetical protein